MLTDIVSFSELAREKMWSRIHLIPVLQAEEDRDLVRRHWAEQAREKELMGAETKVYNNDRYAMEPLETSRDRPHALVLIVGQIRASHIRSHTQGDFEVNDQPIEREFGRKGQESHVVNIAGSGAFFHVGNHRPITVSNVHTNLDN